MKEMVGGCCVCSDERGWDENPLVYCDGAHCNVAVHQACYGIVTVPSGPWYCRKCESHERPGRVGCELCPSRDGALKKTDSSGWAHVVCALYIPEVRFGNVTTMEPILISLIPAERFNKTCYICEDKKEKASVGASMQGRLPEAKKGACMQCNKAGCKQNFHVTCAQYKGLLCEEAGNMMDNVKYCGYCDYHYGKLKKTSNMKIIPPFKPVPSSSAASSPASSPEKNNQKHAATAESLHSSGNNGANAAAASGSSGIASIPNPNVSPDINKGSSNSKPSLKRGAGSNNGKSSSTANNNSSSSSANSSTNPSPIPRIQSSSMFSSGAFSSSLSGSRHPSGEKSKGHERLVKTEDEGGRSEGKAGTSIEERSHRGKGSSSFQKSKDYAILSMSDIVTAALDHSPSVPSKFDLPGISASGNLTRGIEPSASSPLTTASHRIDKPPPDIKPHVTLTPIPMRSSDDSKDNRSSKSPALTFPSTFGQGHKLQTTPPDDREKRKTESDETTPTKRARPGPDIYDSDTESASESWPNRQEDESESQSRTEIHLSRKERFLAGAHSHSHTSNRMLTSQQAQNISHWESSSRSPQVTLERMRFSGREPSPFNSKMYSTDFIPKRGPGRPVKRRSGTSRDDENSETKSTSRSRGRRGGNSSYSGRHGKDNAGLINGGDDRENPFEDPSMDSNGGVSSSGRGGRHSGLTRKTGASNNNSSLPKRPNYEEGPTMSFAQLKAQSAGASDKAPAHMFGNLLNPASSMAQKMVDSLSQEIETIAEGTDNITPQNQLVGISFPGKSAPSAAPSSTTSIPSAAPPQTLEELLERQWEQGSQFLMEQAQHLDIAQLLSCLNQLKQDNRALEDHVNSLMQRKEHLSAINARLSIPLGSSSSLVSVQGYNNQGSGSHGTPPLGSQGNKSNSLNLTHNGSAVPSPQLQQQIMQESAIHQSRIPTHPFPGTEGMHGHHVHRNHHTSNSGQGQIFGYPGLSHQSGGLPVPVVVASHSSPNQHSSNSHHPSNPRDSR